MNIEHIVEWKKSLTNLIVVTLNRLHAKINAIAFFYVSLSEN